MCRVAPLSDLSPEQFPPPSRAPCSPGPSLRVFLIVSLCSDWHWDMILVNYMQSPRVYFQPFLLNRLLLPIYFWASIPLACSRPRARSLASRIRWFRPLLPPPRAAVLANHCTRAPGRLYVSPLLSADQSCPSKCLLTGICPCLMPSLRLIGSVWTRHMWHAHGHPLSGHSNPRCAQRTPGGEIWHCPLS